MKLLVRMCHQNGPANLSVTKHLPPEHGDQPILHAFPLLDRLKEELGAGENETLRTVQTVRQPSTEHRNKLLQLTQLRPSCSLTRS